MVVRVKLFYISMRRYNYAPTIDFSIIWTYNWLDQDPVAEPRRGKRGQLPPLPPIPFSYLFLIKRIIYIYIYIYIEWVGLSCLPNNYIFYTCAVRNFTCIGVWLWLLFKVFFVPKCIKMIFFIFKKLFLRSAHQNNLKHTKKN